MTKKEFNEMLNEIVVSNSAWAAGKYVSYREPKLKPAGISETVERLKGLFTEFNKERENNVSKGN